MAKKYKLFIDVDDTIIANCYKGSGFDLRPGALTQLRVLTKLYDCEWLTMWPKKDIFALVRSLYGSYINTNIGYADWETHPRHPWRKAGYVLDPKRTQDFYWLEDPLCPEEMHALRDHKKLDRYIRVEPFGQFAFLDAVNELFKRSGVGTNELKRVGASPEWFDREAIMHQNPDKENLRETLSMLRVIASTTTLDPEAKLKEVQSYIDNQLETLY
jgi:hypothetical protein